MTVDVVVEGEEPTEARCLAAGSPKHRKTLEWWWHWSWDEKTLHNTQMFVIWNGLLWLSLVASVVEQLNWFSTDRRADKNKYTSANNLFIREIAVYLETPSDCNLPAEQQLKKMPSNKSHHTSINCGMAGKKMYDARTSSPSGWMSSIIPHYRGNVMLTIIIN